MRSIVSLPWTTPFWRTSLACTPLLVSASATSCCLRLYFPVPSNTRRTTFLASPICSIMSSMPCRKSAFCNAASILSVPGRCIAGLRGMSGRTSPMAEYPIPLALNSKLRGILSWCLSGPLFTLGMGRVSMTCSTPPFCSIVDSTPFSGFAIPPMKGSIFPLLSWRPYSATSTLVRYMLSISSARASNSSLIFVSS